MFYDHQVPECVCVTYVVFFSLYLHIAIYICCTVHLRVRVLVCVLWGVFWFVFVCACVSVFCVMFKILKKYAMYVEFCALKRFPLFRFILTIGTQTTKLPMRMVSIGWRFASFPCHHSLFRLLVFVFFHCYTFIFFVTFFSLLYAICIFWIN